MGKINNVILIDGGKGGVGKTTVAVNLSRHLAKRYRVGLLDSDLLNPTLPCVFGKETALRAQKNRIIPHCVDGIRLMSAGYLPTPERGLVLEAPLLRGILRQFLSDVDWGDLDFLVIDCPPGDWQVQATLSSLIQVSRAVVVTTIDTIAIGAFYRCVSRLESTPLSIGATVMNMLPAPEPGRESGTCLDNGREKNIETKYPIICLPQIRKMDPICLLSGSPGNKAESDFGCGISNLADLIIP